MSRRVGYVKRKLPILAIHPAAGVAERYAAEWRGSGSACEAGNPLHSRVQFLKHPVRRF